MKYTIKEFAQEIRKLYPGDYDDMSDQELVDRWLRKYPSDRDKVEIGSPFQSQKIQEPERKFYESQLESPRRSYENKYQGLGDELSKSVHKSKTFVVPAIFTLFLYYIGFLVALPWTFIIGLLVNIILLSSANNNKRITGEDPPGRGFLKGLLIFNLVLVGIFVVLLIFLGREIYSLFSGSY